RLSVVNDAGELKVQGPEDGDWAAYVVLSVPTGVTLDLSAHNGGLSLRDVDGHFTLRTLNGPISLAGVGGVVDASAVNGPISLRGHAGDVRLTAQNGPIGVDLDAPTWTGRGLDASAQNGPVELKAPPDLKSGVQVDGSSSSPVSVNGFSPES